MPINFKPHGNSKENNTEPYVRTNPSVLKKAAEMAKTETVNNVFVKLTEDDSFSAPQSTKQVRDKNPRTKKNRTRVIGHPV